MAASNVVPFARPLPGHKRVSEFRKALQALNVLIEFSGNDALMVIDHWAHQDLITEDEGRALREFIGIAP